MDGFAFGSLRCERVLQVLALSQDPKERPRPVKKPESVAPQNSAIWGHSVALRFAAFSSEFRRRLCCISDGRRHVGKVSRIALDNGKAKAPSESE